jgi:acyl dehydratase
MGARSNTVPHVKKDNDMQGLYYEEFEIGQGFTSRGRTVTETDIVNFAGVSGDFNPVHTNAEYAAKTQFGKRIAHGALGLSIATGLAYSMGFLEGTVIAFTALDWKFRAPIYIGDTVMVAAEVAKKRDVKQTGGGFVTIDMKLLNQRDEVTQKGTMTVLVAGKPDDSGTGDSVESTGE